MFHNRGIRVRVNICDPYARNDPFIASNMSRKVTNSFAASEKRYHITLLPLGLGHPPVAQPDMSLPSAQVGEVGSMIGGAWNPHFNLTKTAEENVELYDTSPAPRHDILTIQTEKEIIGDIFYGKGLYRSDDIDDPTDRHPDEWYISWKNTQDQGAFVILGNPGHRTSATEINMISERITQDWRSWYKKYQRHVYILTSCVRTSSWCMADFCGRSTVGFCHGRRDKVEFHSINTKRYHFGYGPKHRESEISTKLRQLAETASDVPRTTAKEDNDDQGSEIPSAQSHMESKEPIHYHPHPYDQTILISGFHLFPRRRWFRPATWYSGIDGVYEAVCMCLFDLEVEATMALMHDVDVGKLIKCAEDFGQVGQFFEWLKENARHALENRSSSFLSVSLWRGYVLFEQSPTPLQC
ncbi:hypothetical protein BU17DRAFT_63720 [Hysterangium stoloniferum]|nr:hypothetical protein BU17DRAFT_63720 [Hysterangium stoloniferum]